MAGSRIESRVGVSIGKTSSDRCLFQCRQARVGNKHGTRTPPVDTTFLSMETHALRSLLPIPRRRPIQTCSRFTCNSPHPRMAIDERQNHLPVPMTATPSELAFSFLEVITSVNGQQEKKKHSSWGGNPGRPAEAVTVGVSPGTCTKRDGYRSAMGPLC